MERLAFSYVAQWPPDAGAGEIDAQLTERIQALGGEISWAGTEEIVASFDALDLHAVIELGLELLDGAGPPAVLRIGIALDAARGEDDAGEHVPFEATVERARRLSWAAAPFELLLDEGVRDAAASVFLFDADPSTGAYRLDRREPRRAGCRRAVRFLRPAPLPTSTTRSLLPLVAELLKPGSHRIVLRGGCSRSIERAIEWLGGRLGPRTTLAIGGVPGGLEPLGSLRHGLRDLGVGSDGDSPWDGKPLANRTLARITQAEPVSRAEAVRALAHLFEACDEAGSPVRVLLDGTAPVDASTLEVLSEAATRASGNLLVATTVYPEAAALEGFGGFERGREFVLPSLTAADAFELSAAILGPNASRDIVAQVAARGGTSIVGIEEAARSMVASGDLVFRDDRFVWRATPRHVSGVVPVEALVGERLATLDEAPHRVLDVVCVVPRGSSEELIDEIAAADGLDAQRRRGALEQLREEGFLAPGLPLRPSSEAVQSAVRDAMPPAREAELERFVAEALLLAEGGVFATATQGYFLAQGGRPREAAEALLSAGHAAIAEGFGRAAVGLAAAAVQCHASSEIRGPAAVIARAARLLPKAAFGPPAPLSTVPAPPGDLLDEFPVHESLARRTVVALLRRDYEALERCLDLAIAEGCDRTAAARLRAVGSIARGDRAAAYCELEKARIERDEPPRRAARNGIARAIVLLHDRRSSDAIVAALSALEAARRGHDLRGEGAALHVLAACYRDLGRFEDADRIEDASPV